MGNEFEQSIDKAIHQIELNMMHNVQKACDVVLNQSSDNINDMIEHQSGALRASKFSEVKKEGDDIVGYIGYSIDYATYVHEGTGVHAKDGNGRKTPWVYKDERTGKFYTTTGQKPKPFLQNALDSSQKVVNKLLGS